MLAQTLVCYPSNNPCHLMLSVHQSKEAWSEGNLFDFKMWYANKATQKERQECQDLYILIHKGMQPSDLLTVPGSRHIIPTKECDGSGWSEVELQQQAPCQRCLNNKGGYRFAWTHKAWTTPEVLDAKDHKGCYHKQAKRLAWLRYSENAKYAMNP